MSTLPLPLTATIGEIADLVRPSFPRERSTLDSTQTPEDLAQRLADYRVVLAVRAAEQAAQHPKGWQGLFSASARVAVRSPAGGSLEVQFEAPLPVSSPRHTLGGSRPGIAVESVPPWSAALERGFVFLASGVNATVEWIDAARLRTTGVSQRIWETMLACPERWVREVAMLEVPVRAPVYAEAAA